MNELNAALHLCAILQYFMVGFAILGVAAMLFLHFKK